jgi:hypothetical protein
MAKYIFTFTIILLAALSRLLPHLPNMAPITAIALFGAVYLDKKHTFVVPMAAMLISDYFIGFHSEMVWVYASFIIMGFLGLWLRNHQSIGKTIMATLGGSVIFFIITNFGAWVSPYMMYPQTFSGLGQCYIAAIPFFRNTIAGDLIYVSAMFGLYEFAKRYIPSLQLKTSKVTN